MDIANCPWIRRKPSRDPDYVISRNSSPTGFSQE